MTTILYANKTLALDRMALSSNRRLEARKHRIHKGYNANAKPFCEILAFAGSYSEGIALANWYIAGADPDTWPSFQTKEEFTELIVYDALTGLCSQYEAIPVKLDVIGGVDAWGSGAKYALGAYSAGATIEKSMRIAARYDVGTGIGFDIFTLSGHHEEITL